MKNLLNFFLEVEKLKQMPRSGWVWLKVKNPETVAEHIFRVAIASWLLAEKRNFNVKRAILIALFHDLCEIYSGDMTPYFDLLPKNEGKRKEILKRWIRLPKKEKEKRAKKKFEVEKRSLLRLIKFLEPKVRQQILNFWLDCEKGISPEGKFVKQVDKIETMIQAIEYFGVGKDTPVVGWWEEVEELVEDPLLLKFLKVIQEKLYYKRSVKNSEELEKILDFLLKIGKLKGAPRRGWLLRGIKNPETIASHTFMLALMIWIFSKKIGLKMDKEKIIKMALCHELCEVYAGDMTPYEPFLDEGKNVFKKWIRLSKNEKERFFIKDYNKEEKATLRLTKNLPPDLKQEIIRHWDDFKKNKSKEAHFLHQIYAISTLLQALQYWKKNKDFPIKSWWEWTFEIVDQPMILDFVREMERKFLS